MCRRARPGAREAGSASTRPPGGRSDAPKGSQRAAAVLVPTPATRPTGLVLGPAPGRPQAPSAPPAARSVRRRPSARAVRLRCDRCDRPDPHGPSAPANLRSVIRRRGAPARPALRVPPPCPPCRLMRPRQVRRGPSRGPPASVPGTTGPPPLRPTPSDAADPPKGARDAPGRLTAQRSSGRLGEFGVAARGPLPRLPRDDRGTALPLDASATGARIPRGYRPPGRLSRADMRAGR
ncbi:hypothetical protein BJY54_006385 [Streptomyces nodosus]|nr:hypothetical protein [Streptomyces nodosus]